MMSFLQKLDEKTDEKQKNYLIINNHIILSFSVRECIFTNAKFGSQQGLFCKHFNIRCT